MFALRFKDTKEFVGFEFNSNGDADFCVSVEFTLERNVFTDNVWVTGSRETAEKVTNNSSEWFNAGFDSPKNPFVGRLEVVELVVK